MNARERTLLMWQINVYQLFIVIFQWLNDRQNVESPHIVRSLLVWEYLPIFAGNKSDNLIMRGCDLTGQKFSRLTVICRSKTKKKSWLCRCDCGVESCVLTSNLIGGTTKSCGCLHKEVMRDIFIKKFTTHGHRPTGRFTPEYNAWKHIKDRCCNTNNKCYHIYGGRGISICERWRLSFDNFFSDMGYRPAKGYSIERIDNNGNYEPKNCRWATQKEQLNNTRKNVCFEYCGEMKTIAQLSEISGVNYHTLRYRLGNMSVESAMIL